MQLASKHRSEYSDVESSDVDDEEVHRSCGSTTELRHAVTDPLRLPCDSEIAIKASQFQIAQKASRGIKAVSLVLCQNQGKIA